MKRLFILSTLVGLSGFSVGDAAAQLSIAVRGTGGLPMSQFAEAAAAGEDEVMIAGAEQGFGMGLDASLSLGRALGLYAGFDRVRFGCVEASCGEDGEYRLSGFAAGVQVNPWRRGLVQPWVRGGLTFGELDGTYGSQGRQLSSERSPGYSIGAGFHLPILGMLSLSPQVRYVGQHARVSVPGIDAPRADRNVGYLSVDLGLAISSPFGGL
jgi:hypothetical protein